MQFTKTRWIAFVAVVRRKNVTFANIYLRVCVFAFDIFIKISNFVKCYRFLFICTFYSFVTYIAYNFVNIRFYTVNKTVISKNRVKGTLTSCWMDSTILQSVSMDLCCFMNDKLLRFKLRILTYLVRLFRYRTYLVCFCFSSMMI